MSFFEDSEGRFNITVPSVEVTQGTSYTCNITNQVPLFNGVKAGMYVPMLLNHIPILQHAPIVMHFSFISSLIGVPFDRTDNSLTVIRCAATDRYNDYNDAW